MIYYFVDKRKIISGKKDIPAFNSEVETTSISSGKEGFTLVEVVVAMVILLIALLGVFITFTYAVNYNAGNNSRSEALAIMQQEVEKMRSAKFTPAITDSILKGGKKIPFIVTGDSRNRFKVQITVDDDPIAPDIQTDNTKTIKEVSITVTLDKPTPGWQTAVPATVILQRVRSN